MNYIEKYFHNKYTLLLFLFFCSDTDQTKYMIQINALLSNKYYSFAMIKLLQRGSYSLIETKRHIKILTLDQKQLFAWIIAGEIGEILVVSHNPHKADHILSVGKYRMYEVKDEPDLTDLIHLELLTGDAVWQGYLLPKGLPTDEKKRNRIIPTREIITKSAH